MIVVATSIYIHFLYHLLTWPLRVSRLTCRFFLWICDVIRFLNRFHFDVRYSVLWCTGLLLFLPPRTIFLCGALPPSIYALPRPWCPVRTLRASYCRLRRLVAMVSWAIGTCSYAIVSHVRWAPRVIWILNFISPFGGSGVPVFVLSIWSNSSSSSINCTHRTIPRPIRAYFILSL